MPHFLNTLDAEFETRFLELLGMKREDSPDVDHIVADIIADVRSRGDDAVLEMTAKGLGMTAVLDETQQLLGIFTDGDLRRCFDNQDDLRGAVVGDLMTSGGVCIKPQQLAAEALAIMEEKKINALLVTDDQGNLVGAMNMHDLLRAGVV